MLVEEFLKLFPRLGVHFLYRHALVSDDDSLLRLPLDIYHSLDVYLLLCLLERLTPYLHSIGYLLVIEEEDLLADNL